jgi:hypothetical protein
MIMRRNLLAFLILSFFIPSIAVAQDYFRIKSDFTVKISNSNGTKNLTKGVVYYDKNFKDLIYDISFPNKEKWVSRDTLLLKYRNDTLVEKITIPAINEFSVFHLSLNSGLSDFGLRNTIYNMSKVEKKGDLVLSYWKIPKQASDFLDHVVVAKKGNRLESVIMVGNELKIMSKQFFRNYFKTGAFEFPQQIIQVIYDKAGKENYQMTEFKNIKLNDIADNKSYRFKK